MGGKFKIPDVDDQLASISDADHEAREALRVFSTIFTALGIDPYAEYDLPGLPRFHRVEVKADPIRAILA